MHLLSEERPALTATVTVYSTRNGNVNRFRQKPLSSRGRLFCVLWEEKGIRPPAHAGTIPNCTLPLSYAQRKVDRKLTVNRRKSVVYLYCRETRTAVTIPPHPAALPSCVGGVALTLRGFHPLCFCVGLGSLGRGPSRPRKGRGSHTKQIKHPADRWGVFLFAGRSVGV